MADGYTLVIPTHNRPALLQRLVRYYRKQAPSFNLLVLDSSRSEVVEDNAKALAVAGKSVRHVAFPGNLPPLAKIVRGLELVETPYSSFCADDDLVFPEALVSSANFLEHHADYVSAHGLYLNFRQAGNDVHLRSEYSGPGNEATHPGARIFRLLQRYESLFYGAFRTTALREIFVAMQAMPTEHFMELFQSVATVIKGKVKRFPSFFAARQSGIPPAHTHEKWQTYYWFADNPVEMIEHYGAYCEEVWRFYEAHASAPRLEKTAFFKTLHLAHAGYFSAGYPPEYSHSVLQTNWPGDSFVDVRNVDLLEQLAPADRPRQAVLRIWRSLWRRWQDKSLGYGLARLNREAAGACRTGWRCHLPVRLHWLAGVADFRKNWLELCLYLDQS